MEWIQKTRGFLGEVQSELKRTTFPSPKEVRGTTTVVVVTVIIFAVFLYVVDMFLYRMVNLLFDWLG
jgi:preprotein translocase subunit SecE